MKAWLIIPLFFLSCGVIPAQDAHFEFHSPFGSDGTNQPGLDPQVRNCLVLDRIWMDYIAARKEIVKPFPQAPPEETQASLDHSFKCFRYGQLLQTMAELRAFSAQNKGYVNEVQKSEILRMDKVLRSLNLFYHPSGTQQMVDYCDKMGPGQVRQSLNSILYADDKTLRPTPPMEFGRNEVVVKDRPIEIKTHP